MSKGIYIRRKPSWNKEKTFEEMYGIEKAKQLKEKISKNNRKRYTRGERFGFQIGHSDFVTKEGRKRQALKMIGNLYGWQKGKVSNRKGVKLSIETKDKISKNNWTRKPGAKEKLSKIAKELWKNPEHARKCLSISLPSSLEKKTEYLLKNELKLKYEYTGNGTFLIQRKCPDFVNFDQKKIIEVYGDYWHLRPENRLSDSKRINIFKEHGYSVLIIWGSEFKDINSLKRKILNFENKAISEF